MFRRLVYVELYLVVYIHLQRIGTSHLLTTLVNGWTMNTSETFATRGASYVIANMSVTCNQSWTDPCVGWFIIPPSNINVTDRNSTKITKESEDIYPASSDGIVMVFLQLGTVTKHLHMLYL